MDNNSARCGSTTAIGSRRRSGREGTLIAKRDRKNVVTERSVLAFCSTQQGVRCNRQYEAIP